MYVWFVYFLNWQKLKYTLQVRPFLTRRWGLISTPRLFRTERVSGFRKDRGVFGVCARSAWHIMSGSVPQTIKGWKTQGANCIWPLLSLLLVGLVTGRPNMTGKKKVQRWEVFFCPPFLSSDLVTLIEWLGEKCFGLIFFDPSWLFPIIHKIYTSNPKPKTPPEKNPSENPSPALISHGPNLF